MNGQASYEILDMDNKKGYLEMKARILQRADRDRVRYYITIPAQFGKEWAGKEFKVILMTEEAEKQRKDELMKQIERWVKNSIPEILKEMGLEVK